MEVCFLVEDAFLTDEEVVIFSWTTVPERPDWVRMPGFPEEFLLNELLSLPLPCKLVCVSTTLMLLLLLPDSMLLWCCYF